MVEARPGAGGWVGDGALVETSTHRPAAGGWVGDGAGGVVAEDAGPEPGCAAPEVAESCAAPAASDQQSTSTPFSDPVTEVVANVAALQGVLPTAAEPSEAPPSGQGPAQMAPPSGQDPAQMAPPSDQDSAPLSGLDPSQVPVPSGLEPSQVPTPSGLDTSQVPIPSGLDPSQVPTPSGLDPSQVPTPSELDPSQVPTPSGLEPSQVPTPSGLEPAHVAPPADQESPQVVLHSDQDPASLTTVEDSQDMTEAGETEPNPLANLSSDQNALLTASLAAVTGKTESPLSGSSPPLDDADDPLSGVLDAIVNLLPSQSDLEQLMDGAVPDPPAAPPVAPVGEDRIDPATCQVNLLTHVTQMQMALMSRVETIEGQIDVLEKVSSQDDDWASERPALCRQTLQAMLREVQLVERMGPLS